MSKKNPEYDFKWCPGCGDFGVRRALELAMIERLEESGQPAESNVVVSGNCFRGPPRVSAALPTGTPFPLARTNLGTESTK